MLIKFSIDFIIFFASFIKVASLYFFVLYLHLCKYTYINLYNIENFCIDTTEHPCEKTPIMYRGCSSRDRMRKLWLSYCFLRLDKSKQWTKLCHKNCFEEFDTSLARPHHKIACLKLCTPNKYFKNFAYEACAQAT